MSSYVIVAFIVGTVILLLANCYTGHLTNKVISTDDQLKRIALARAIDKYGKITTIFALLWSVSVFGMMVYITR